ncbi:MAG: beta-ketoacyl-ACP synthase II [Alphaproteobacteria bacterium]|nr:beta-ketoacyl-ACP synthase II [Alphaproteobacteria bacterium]
MRRVVVTGIGVLSPLGYGHKANWEALVKGQSGLSKIRSFDPTDYVSQVAGHVPVGREIGQFNPDEILSPKEQRHVDPFILYGMAAGQQAVQDLNWLPETEEEKNRFGVYFGSGVGGLMGIINSGKSVETVGPRRLTPFAIPSILINLIGGHLSIKYGLQGPNIACATACATGSHAIGEAARLIRDDRADIMLAGSSEAAICPVGIAGFSQMRALSNHFNETPQKASRPWDKERDGFVMAEGAGAVVLEEYEHAKKRGAKIYGELVGYGLTADAYHFTAPGGTGAKRAILQALKEADITPDQVDYINAHGTSTPMGDLVEFKAVKEIFDGTNVAMSSTKSMTGHMLGAAGSAEAVYTLLAMQNNVLPPTINLDNPEEETAGFNLVPHKAQEKQVTYALSNSFGFGGTNATLLFKKVLNET